MLLLTKFLGAGCDFDGDFVSSSSQDNFRRLSTTFFGGVFLSTPVNFARYIGNVGEHFTEETYRVAGYAQMAVVSGEPTTFAVPSEADLLFDLNARICWYRRFEQDGIPIWSNDEIALVEEDGVYTLEKIAAAASTNVRKVKKIARRETWAGPEASKVRGRLMGSAYRSLAFAFDYIKIDVHNKRENFFHAVSLPISLLHSDLDLLCQRLQEKGRKTTFVLEGSLDEDVASLVPLVENLLTQPAFNWILMSGYVSRAQTLCKAILCDPCKR